MNENSAPSPNQSEQIYLVWMIDESDSFCSRSFSGGKRGATAAAISWAGHGLWNWSKHKWTKLYNAIVNSKEAKMSVEPHEQLGHMLHRVTCKLTSWHRVTCQVGIDGDRRCLIMATVQGCISQSSQLVCRWICTSKALHLRGRDPDLL